MPSPPRPRPSLLVVVVPESTTTKSRTRDDDRELRLRPTAALCRPPVIRSARSKPGIHPLSSHPPVKNFPYYPNHPNKHPLRPGTLDAGSCVGKLSTLFLFSQTVFEFGTTVNTEWWVGNDSFVDAPKYERKRSDGNAEIVHVGRDHSRNWLACRDCERRWPAKPGFVPEWAMLHGYVRDVSFQRVILNDGRLTRFIDAPGCVVRFVFG